MFLIPIFAIVSMYYLYWKINQKKFGAVSFLISIYGAMSLSAVILYVFYDFDISYQIELEPMLYLSLCLAILFFGLFTYSDKRISVLVIDNWKLLKVLEIFQMITACAAIIFFVPFAIHGLSGDIGENRHNLQEYGAELAAYGIVNSICSLAGNLFQISIVLALINFATLGRGGSRLRGQILLLLSSVYIIYILAYVGRDGVVYWVFSVIFIYLMLREFIPQTEQRKMMSVVLKMIALSLVPFILITLSRFGSSADTAYIVEGYSPLLSFFDYAGSQIFNFNDIYRADAPPMMGLVNFGQTLEIVSKFTGEEVKVLDQFAWYADYTSSGAVPWSFSTFIGSWLGDFGRIGTVVAVFLLAFFTRLTLRRASSSGELRFTNILFFLLLSQIPLFGVFYYRQYSSTYAQLFILLLAAFFTLYRGSRDEFRIEKL